MAKPSPTLQSAVTWVRSRAQQYAVDKATARSTVRALAVEAGVSYTTMWKALRIAGVRTRSLLLRPAAAEPKAARPRQRPCLWTARAIAADITEGRFAHDQVLPSLKQLSHTYRTSYRTLVKALGVLCGQDLCRRVGSRYVVRHLHRRTRRSTVLLVAQGQADGTVLLTAERPASLLAGLRRGPLLQADSESCRASPSTEGGLAGLLRPG